MDSKDLIFISHATPTDNTFAVWLATKLELCGYKVWVDVNNLSPSVDFWQMIESTIRNEAVKFLFVASSSSLDPRRDGIQKELAVADKVRRNNPSFITPLRLDSVSFNDFPVEILRLNAIDFKTDWAEGLKKLLKSFEEENIPRSATHYDSLYYLARWKKSQADDQPLVTDDMDEYCSNLVGIDKPPLVYTYLTSEVEDVLREHHVPMKKNKKIVITFACRKCVSAWCGHEVLYEVFNTNEIINRTELLTSLGEKIENPSRDIISLINWSIGELFFTKSLKRYKPSSEKTSRNIYYFAFGMKSKRYAESRKKALAGVYKGKKRWHYGLSAFFAQYPAEGIFIKWHLIFSDDKGVTLPESAQIAARRSKGRRMFNKEWKELLQASMYFLADGTDNIYYSPCCEENAMYVRSKSERYISAKSYLEPKQKQVMVEDE